MTDSARLRPRVTLVRTLKVCALLAAALILVSVVALTLGGGQMQVSRAITGLMETLSFSTSSLSSVEQLILFQLRLPRILLAMIVGAALALAGAAFQALLRNPLADPYVLGVSSGASLAAALSMAFAARYPVITPVAAFIGALLTIAFVYFIGHSGEQSSTYTLLLTGIVTASFLYALTMFVIGFLSASGLRGALFWLMGNLSNPSPIGLGWLALSIAAVAVVLYWVAGDLNLMMMGEPEAETLGVHVRRTKIIVYVAASLATGIAVSVSGSIGYIGLIVPHGIRLLFGSDYRLLLPAAAFGGAITLVAADTVARTIVATRMGELQVGAVTAVLGAPVFLYLLRRPRVAQSIMAQTATDVEPVTESEEDAGEDQR